MTLTIKKLRVRVYATLEGALQDAENSGRVRAIVAHGGGPWQISFQPTITDVIGFAVLPVEGPVA